jgi:thymidylate kinase
MQDVPVTYCSHKEISTETPLEERTMREVAAILWPSIDPTFVRSLPSRYRVHLHAAWYSLFSELVLERRVASGEILLLDSWCYKFLAHLIVYGYRKEELEVIFSHVPHPDLVGMLDVDPKDVWERTREFGPIELGLYMDYPELGRASFCHYQGLIRDVLLEMAEEHGWVVVPIGGSESVEDVAQALEARIRDALPAGAGRSEARSL